MQTGTSFGLATMQVHVFDWYNFLSEEIYQNLGFLETHKEPEVILCIFLHYYVQSCSPEHNIYKATIKAVKQVGNSD